MDFVFRIWSYLIYICKARTNLYIHSPFVFEFCNEIRDAEKSANIENVNHFFKELKSTQSFEFDHPLLGFRSVSLKRLVETSSMNVKYGKILNRLVSFYKPQKILEIGTHIGAGTSYLLSGNNFEKAISLEGSSILASLANNHLKALGICNVDLRVGLFEDNLQKSLEDLKEVDLIFFDGHHTKEATLKYFEICIKYKNVNSIFVFDDIYWSSEMAEAWLTISKHSEVKLSIDLYRFGICFFRKENLVKEDFRIFY